MVSINYLAVFAAGVAQFILGAFWYGPLFGAKWGKLMGFEKPSKAKMKELQKQMTVSYLVTALTGFLTAYVLAYYIFYTNAADVAGGLLVGFWIWLGFVLTIQISQSMWTQKSKMLVLIDSGYYLVGYMIMGVILALWR